MRKVRDPELLERMQQLPAAHLKARAWRITRAGRDPLLASSPKGRWDDGSFDVFYTALAPDTARAELYWHLTRSQPVYPSALRLHLHELEFDVAAAVTIDTVEQLESFGVDPQRFGHLEYARLHEEYSVMQRIGEAAHFLGRDALIVPSARWLGQNLVILTGNLKDGKLTPIKDHGHQDLKAWAADHASV